MARACVAGVLLLHDDLEKSHTISQGIEAAEGSYWHGIMHRREPDYPNAKYWFGKVGPHQVFDELAEHNGGSWDPYDFIDDIARAAAGDAALARRCGELQMLEFNLLFKYCYDRTIA